ncbi:provisional ortholog of cytochrome P450, family 2, subfamily j, polypeptide 6 S homeolog isoform X2 [Xenopus laevis]|uniref:Provisional ortholog of cytochrome P450, family 2, subfamily j, polypeptide 6 S homeolog isoform X2 n=1 Tax=Xenopus laevis TaxID=8355 RepID=A0A8J1LQ36_XENLA|nr:provisional ortholog of cytochrome P450, family 2, subfamily j, polypeptide 6 S homeolog isoform X2 [Xenopus laevis]
MLNMSFTQETWSLQQILLAFLVCVIAVKYIKMRWAARSLPPGPTPLPLIGNLWALQFKLHPKTLRKIAVSYGDIYTLWLGHTPLVVLSGCRSVRNGLISHSEELSGRPVDGLMQALTNERGIGSTNGHTWKQQRRFGLMTLRNLGLGKRGLESRIQEEAQCLVESLAAKNGEPVNPSDLIVHAVANVISAVVFGHRFSIEDPTFQEMVRCNGCIVTNLGTAWGRIYDAFPWLMRYVPGPHQSSFAAMAYLTTFIKKEIKLHELNGPNEQPQDLIEYYLAQIAKTKLEPDTTFDEANMIQMVIDLFIAGTETTATSLQWALLYMVAFPEIQNFFSKGKWIVTLTEKVQEELDTVLDGSQLAYYEDKKRLPFTNAVIHEVQRYGNIASNTMVLPNLDSVLHDQHQWETPYKFNPNHFLDKNGNFCTSEAFLPFSAGHRVCLGEQLARFELFIFFTTLLHRFNIELPEGITEVNTKYVFKMTLQPHPYEICAVPR